MENADFSVSCGRKTFGKRRWRHDNHVISLLVFSSNTNSKWPVIGVFFNFSSIAWTENSWFVSRLKVLFSNSSAVAGMGLNLIFCTRACFFTCYPGYLRNMFSLRSVSYSLRENYVLSCLVLTPFHTRLQNYGILFRILLKRLTFLISSARFYSIIVKF